jgi:predicted phage baseplate assembly protein
VRVTEPGGGALWREVDTLASSTPADRHFVVLRDAVGAATILFGDDTNGMAPPPSSPAAEVRITATYRVTDGPPGNVPTATAFRSAMSSIREATNPQAAAGGTPGEPFDRARRLAPRLFRTQERAVTLGDYTDLAQQVAGVGKARAAAVGWNEVVLHVAPSGQVAEPSELLRRDLLAFFERRRMATTFLTVAGPDPADIYLRADVQAQPYYLRSDVRAAVEGAVAGYLAFDAVDFGQPVYLSRVYDAIQSLPQVASLNITQFSREPTGGIAADGVILLGPSELPRPGYRDNPPAGVAPTPIVVSLQGGVTDEPEATP